MILTLLAYEKHICWMLNTVCCQFSPTYDGVTDSSLKHKSSVRANLILF